MLPQIFNYQDNQIRVIMLDGSPWWVAKDVCDILELFNVGQALARLEDDEKNSIILNDGTPGNPNITVVSEAGLYSLILSSRKKEARLFKRWITHEVIPEIRAHFFDAVASSKDAIDLGSAAKVLNMGIGRNRLFEILREEKVLMSNNQPYQTFIDRGYFRTIEQKYTVPSGETRISIKTLVYQKGLNYIRKVIEKTA